MITRTITITTQKERIVLVELLHTEYAQTHSTNGMRSLCVVIVIVLNIAAVGPGLNRARFHKAAKRLTLCLLSDFHFIALLKVTT